ncbi:HD domain-containing protein [Clostridium gasigenes]|uniref:helix-turn-helix domain-containing protein n=1 Tax=Clostridium gasigenes TaxID=94869 RepID=UPI001C0E5BB2|nr:AraC family transcriptional regulator [Clostridium gasigenes]MBU3136175.1 HD domain-containing protein [Clostridium gasigenes]
MKYLDSIFNCITYIEENITADLTLDNISQNIGYSTYHFSRIFKEEMGVSIMEYVKERKMLKAIEDITLGNKILDVAIKYGYKTNSGFTKAFRKKYSFSPVVIKMLYNENLNNRKGGDYIMDKDKVFQEMDIFLRVTESYKEPIELYGYLVRVIERNKIVDDFINIEVAYNLAYSAHKGQKRYSGEEYITHCINVAIILAEMEVDEETIIAGLLHDVIEEETDVTLVKIEEKFSSAISEIVDGVTHFKKENLLVDEKEGLDDRVVMITLADRLHNMRTMEFIDKEKWSDKAKETIEIFSPIAAKLNSLKLKLELDNLALKYF